MALQIGRALFEKNKVSVNSDDEWSVMLVACGLWVNFKERLLPSLLLSEEAVGALEATLQESEHFRKDLAAVSALQLVPNNHRPLCQPLATWHLGVLNMLGSCGGQNRHRQPKLQET